MVALPVPPVSTLLLTPPQDRRHIVVRVAHRPGIPLLPPTRLRPRLQLSSVGDHHEVRVTSISLLRVANLGALVDVTLAPTPTQGQRSTASSSRRTASTSRCPKIVLAGSLVNGILVSTPLDLHGVAAADVFPAAYFSQATLDSLETIDMIPGVGDVQVPSGWFKNARASKARQGDAPRDDDAPAQCQDTWAAAESMTTTFRAQFAIEDRPVHDEKRHWPSPNGGSTHPPQPAQHYEYAPQHHPTVRVPHTGAVSNGRLPNMADAGLDYYRDPSPFTSQSSSSASSDSSPRQYDTPSISPAIRGPTIIPPAPREDMPDRNLVPLSYLTSIHPQVRDPTTADCLRRLASAPRTLPS